MGHDLQLSDLLIMNGSCGSSTLLVLCSVSSCTVPPKLVPAATLNFTKHKKTQLFPGVPFLSRALKKSSK